MTTTPAGVISGPLQDFRVLLSNCDEFQSWTGTANATAALERIYVAGLPLTEYDEFTPDEMDNKRPFAIIEIDPDAGNYFRHHGTDTNRHFNRSGRMFVTFEQAVTVALAEDPAELDRQFQNTIGHIIEGSGNDNGLLDITATDAYFAINTLTVYGPIRASREEAVAQGDWISAILHVTWGND